MFRAVRILGSGVQALHNHTINTRIPPEIEESSPVMGDAAREEGGSRYGGLKRDWHGDRA